MRTRRTSMRGVGVNPVGVRRVTVFFFFIERTVTEAAEQPPPPKSGVRAGGRGDALESPDDVRFHGVTPQLCKAFAGSTGRPSGGSRKIPRSGGPRRRPEPRTITHTSRGTRRSPTRAGGFVFAEPMAPAPLLSVPVAMPPGSLVKYTLDSQDRVHRAWILTPEEAAQPDKPAK